MTVPASTKMRAVGGASVLALTAGIAVPAFAQDREPAPAPTAPAVPGNTEECTFEDGLVTCLPGVDPDGVIAIADGDSNDDDSDGDDSDTDQDGFGGDIAVDIQDGAYLQGGAVLLGDADGTVAGAIVTDGETALLLGDGSDIGITASGYIETSGDGAFGVETGNGVTLTNGGTIYTTGDNAADGVSLGEDSSFVNSGLIRTDGDGSFGVFGADGTSVVNSVDGSIVTTGSGSIGVALGDDGDLDNQGEIETFGEFAVGVEVGEGSSVVNNGSIRTQGEQAFGVSAFDGATITNSGLISTTGLDAAGILASEDSIIDTDGTIETTGEGAFGILAGENADILLGENSVLTTTGDFAGGIVVDGTASIENNGLISTTGEGAVAIFSTGDDSFVKIEVGAEVSTTGDNASAIVIGNGAFLDHNGAISTTGDNSFAVEAGSSSLVVNNISMSTEGAGAVGVLLGDNARFFNSGTLTTTGANAIAVAMGDGAIIETDAVITTTGDGATGILVANDVQIRLEENHSLTTTGSNADAIALLGDVITFENFASISATGEGSNGIVWGGSGTLENFAGGSISGEVGIDGSGEDTDSQTIANFGSITGTGGNAVLFGGGDDQFQQWDTASLVGTVDGGDGTDTLVFGNAGAEEISRDISDLEDGETFTNFESFGFLSLDGAINLTGETDQVVNVLGGDIVLSGTTTNTVVAAGAGSLSVTDTGSIDVDSDVGVDVQVDDFVITNAGTISSGGFAAIDGTDQEGLEVNNTGTIIATGDGGIAIYADNLDEPDSMETTATVSNAGTITTTEDGGIAIAILGNGVVGNTEDATISSDGAGGAAVFIAGTGSVDNDGTIEALGEDSVAVSLGGQTTVDNSGDITGDATGIFLLAGGDVTNTGTITGDIGIDATGTVASNTVANFGTITGEDGDAILLGAGEDEFQQWTDAVVLGNVDLGSGDDTFILEGRLSSIDGIVDGGSGEDDSDDDDDDDSDNGLEGENDVAILAGILDRDGVDGERVFQGFESVQFGSLLDDTLSDLEVEGDRTFNDDFTIVGEVLFDLGEDSLATDGTITFAETGTVTVNTPLNQALIGQTIDVITAGDVDDQGGTLNIIDDDLLLDYTADGFLSVTVDVVNPGADDSDRNVRVFSEALVDAIEDGTIGDDTFDLFNDLDDGEDFRNAVSDVLPSLSGAAGREIFETASAASQAIAHPHATEGAGIWAQAMYRTAEQDSRELTTDGYESAQKIFAAGADFVALDNFALGVIGSYADIENDDVNRNKVIRGTSDIESIKVGGYASGSFFGASFFAAELSYLTGEVEDDRTGIAGDISSEYDFDGYFARAEFGIDLAGADNVGIIPTIGVHHASIDFDDAVETGGLGFSVERDDVDFTELRGGLEINGDVGNFATAYAEATYIHDLEDEPRSFLLNSSDVGPFTAHLPLREEDRFEVAAGAMIGLSEGFGLEIGYLGDFADGYDAHAARANLRFTF